MDNFFITQEPYIQVGNRRFLGRMGNKLIKSLGLRYTLQQNLDWTTNMNSVEQRINYFHLLDAAIAYQIPGDVVELGCYTGQCALLFQKIIADHRSDKQLHLYDSFDTHFSFKGNVEQELVSNFAKATLKQPILHKGYFEQTLPADLPEQICFAHIDCGFGGEPQQHSKIMLHCLTHLYPRLSRGAVVVLMDYHDNQTGDKGADANPGVKLACDAFFADKPERVASLYGNEYSHGFFRKL
ncbi:MAG: hypothetical protein EOO39_40950 [Cytophagaceae bacterium]|nr:MAG: hypothetical protein EOO39_40950 [Cytophagaceae bacterium]